MEAAIMVENRKPENQQFERKKKLFLHKKPTANIAKALTE